MAAVLCVTAWWASERMWIERLEWMAYDQLMPLNAPSMSSQIVVVAVDDSSIYHMGRWPWPREIHGRLIKRLTQYGARAIGLDILISEPDLSNPSSDRQLIEAVRNSQRTVLVVAPAGSSKSEKITELLPMPELAAAASAIGHVDIELDVDGVNRRQYLYAGMHEAHWPSFALALYKVAFGKIPQAFDRIARGPPGAPGGGWVRDHPILIPFAERTSDLIVYSYADLLEGGIPSNLIKDKLILVGATATGLGDQITTPISPSHARTPGVTLNAHILNALLQGQAIYPLSSQNRHLLNTLFIATAVLLVVILPLRVGFFATLSVMLLGILTAVMLLGESLWYPPVTGLILVAASWPLWSLWRIGQQIRLTRRLTQQLRYQQCYHPATGLPNHTMLERELYNRILESSSVTDKLALLVLHFSWPGSANIILGKSIGDPIYHAIAQRLKTCAGSNAFIAHLSDNNFALLIGQSKQKIDLKALTARLMQNLKQPSEIDGQRMMLRPQIGISVWPQDGADVATLLRNAYTAMFKSRLDDRDHICFYSEEVGRELSVRSQLEQALIFAMDRNEFEVHYQPQVNAKTGRIVGVEALLRWHNPQLGWVGPASFIPVAEHVGLIKSIGDWVLEMAAHQLALWHRTGYPHLRMAVNMSPLQFVAPDVEQGVKLILDRVGVAPSMLELEVTESSFMRDLDNAVHIMRKIKRQGLSLSIDDFGTGYSSLSSLRHFPLDRLKIDRSFVQELGKSADANEIVLIILAMGKRLGLRVIAEGVETEAQADFLCRHGCDELQGYLYSRPLPAGEVIVLFERGIPTPREAMG